MGHEDWDLFAIVRSCKPANNNTAETPPTSSTGLFPQDTSNTVSGLATFTSENGPFSFPNLVQPRTNDGFQELHQLLMTFNPTTTTATTSTSGRGINPNSPPFSDFTAGSIGQQHHHHHSQVLSPTTSYTSIGASTSSFDRFHHHQQQHVQQPQPQEQPQQQQKQENQLQVQVPQTSSMVLPNNTLSQKPRSRKRKSQQKKMVCHVTADNLLADSWAWRKYGQKPIKGSPYPRNYYRCSSCKGCAARKQVERSLSDAGIFVVTYTGEHKHAKPAHRNSLAGSTRNKPSTTRLPDTRQESSATSNPEHTRNDNFTANLPRTQNAESEDVTAGDSGGGDDAVEEQEPEDSSEEDDDDVLIPNSTAAMSDVVLLTPSTTTTFNGDDGEKETGSGFQNGSDQNSGPFRIRRCSEPVSDDNRFSPG